MCGLHSGFDKKCLLLWGLARCFAFRVFQRIGRVGRISPAGLREATILVSFREALYNAVDLLFDGLLHWAVRVGSLDDAEPESGYHEGAS